MTLWNLHYSPQESYSKIPRWNSLVKTNQLLSKTLLTYSTIWEISDASYASS